MTIGAFITITKPDKRGDTFEQCYQSAKGFCDEIMFVDGELTWPTEFSWPLIGEHFQMGYEALDTDWVIHLDTDFIFHERDYDKIHHFLASVAEAPAVAFLKWQFILPDRYNLKSRLLLAVNKKRYGERIRFNSGGDLCQPSLDGKEINEHLMPQSRIPFYNYEKLTKTKAQVVDDIGRMERAYLRHFDKPLYSRNGSAYEGWYDMVKGRVDKEQKHIPLKDHPKVMQKTILNLQPNQFGYSMFGYKENSYVKSLSRSR